MALPTFTMRQLLEAGVHFGHSTRRWNPKMAPYLFGDRNKVHIIDLQQTVPMLHAAMKAVRDVVAGGGRVLFVGTKRQAADRVAEAAQRCGQYYVNHRWLGGMMTNWQTISNSIRRLHELEKLLAGDELAGMTKKELLNMTRERDKLERALGGIKDMGSLPDILVVIDTNKEGIAVAEANKLGIPVVGVIDSNSQPDGITYPVAGNDDAIRAINMYCDLMVGSVLDGIQQEVVASGGDLGEKEVTPVEDLSASTPVEEAAPAAEKKPVEAAPAVAEEAAPAVEEKPAEEAPAVAEEATPAAEEKPAEEAPAAAKEEPAEDAKADA